MKFNSCSINNDLFRNIYILVYICDLCVIINFIYSIVFAIVLKDRPPTPIVQPSQGNNYMNFKFCEQEQNMKVSRLL